MQPPRSAVLLLLALAGCGAQPTAATEATGGTLAIAADEGQARPVDRDGITAIDAALGDARAMPADSAEPSAYDLAQRAERARDAEGERDDRVEPAAPAATAAGARLNAPADLADGDESVTSGD